MVGVILAAVSIVGYYGASSAVRNGVERENAATVAEQNAKIDGRLVEKGRIAKADASLLAGICSNQEMTDLKEMLLLYNDDKEVLVIIHGNEHGAFVSSLNGNRTHTISAAAEEQSASSEEIAAASRALAELAGDLQATTKHFKV